MFDVLDELGNAQHPATFDPVAARKSCDELNAVEARRVKDSINPETGKATYTAKRFFVERRFIVYPADVAVVQDKQFSDTAAPSIAPPKL